jgi:hypothetical protein
MEHIIVVVILLLNLAEGCAWSTYAGYPKNMYQHVQSMKKTF